MAKKNIESENCMYCTYEIFYNKENLKPINEKQMHDFENKRKKLIKINKEFCGVGFFSKRQLVKNLNNKKPIGILKCPKCKKDKIIVENEKRYIRKDQIKFGIIMLFIGLLIYSIFIKAQFDLGFGPLINDIWTIVVGFLTIIMMLIGLNLIFETDKLDIHLSLYFILFFSILTMVSCTFFYFINDYRKSTYGLSGIFIMGFVVGFVLMLSKIIDTVVNMGIFIFSKIRGKKQ